MTESTINSLGWGAYLISGLINGVLIREGGLFQILKHCLHLKIVFVQNSKNCIQNNVLIYNVIMYLSVYLCKNKPTGQDEMSQKGWVVRGGGGLLQKTTSKWGAY